MTDSPMDPLVKLGKAVKLASERVDLKLRVFLAEPNLEGETHRVRIALTNEEDAPEVPTVVTDPLNEMWDQADAAEQEEKAKETRQSLTDLEQRLRDPKKGILDD